MNAPTLRVDHLSAGYRQPTGQDAVVIEDASAAVRSGELVCLLGPNGAGKSTLLRTMSGMQRPLAGQVLLDGMDVHAIPPRELARTLSLVLTERPSTSLLTVYEIVSIGRHPHTDWRGTLTSRDHAVVRHAIETVNAQALIGRYLSELSDGERQRVMLARALAQEPRLLILDEITAFLDLPTRVEIMHVLRELAYERGHAVLLSTHDLELALRHADAVWLCPGDRKVTIGLPEELVWNGAFERAFATGGLRFDAERGAFTVSRAPRGTVSVRGTGIHAHWTRRALQRLDLEVVSSSRNGWPEVEVHTVGLQLSWTLRAGPITRHVATLSELLDSVRQEIAARPADAEVLRR